MSEDFGEWYNPSPGWPYMHHNQMGYAVEAVAADGYKFLYWKEWERVSNTPNDVKCEFISPEGWGTELFVDLSTQRDRGIKSPLIYIVAFFKKLEPGPDISENDGCCIPTITDLDEPDGELDSEPYLVSMSDQTKDEILRALDDIAANVEKIRNRVEGL